MIRADGGAPREQLGIRDGSVDRVADVEVGPVVAVGLRQVHGPVAQRELLAEDDVLVGIDAVDERHEALGVHGGRVARRNVVGTHAAARERGRGSVAALRSHREVEDAERVGQLAVHVERGLRGLRVADDARVAGLGAVGAAAVEVFGRERDHALVADAKSAIGAAEIILAVALGVLAVAGDRLASEPALEVAKALSAPPRALYRRTLTSLYAHRRSDNPIRIDPFD